MADNGMSDTQKLKAWVANGGKKKIGAHGLTGGAAILATILTIQQIFGPLSGLADIADLRIKADTTIAMVVKVDSLEKDIDRIDRNIEKLLTSQGVAPEPKDRPETIVIFYVDSTGRGVYTRGDTAYVPREQPITPPR